MVNMMQTEVKQQSVIERIFKARCAYQEAHYGDAPDVLFLGKRTFRELKLDAAAYEYAAIYVSLNQQEVQPIFGMQIIHVDKDEYLTVRNSSDLRQGYEFDPPLMPVSALSHYVNQPATAEMKALGLVDDYSLENKAVVAIKQITIPIIEFDAFNKSQPD